MGSFNELDFLNNNSIENKIVNFFSLYKINLKYNQKISSFSVERYYYSILNNAKIAKIRNLLTELELYVQAQKIKLDFDKDNGNIVFEISKKDRKTLYFEQLENKETEGLTASIGQDINNNEISIDLTKAPHLLIAGSTGSGKSCLLNDIIVSLLNKYNENYLKMILIDIKQVEFTAYKNKKQLAIPTITNVDTATDILNKLIIIMTKRYEILSQSNYNNINNYNENESDKMPYFIIVIDELADLFMQNEEIEIILCRLLQLGRAAGIHLILATQRPDSKTISGKLKINIPTRIALAVTNAHDSRTILNETGAEKLTGKGDFLLKQANGETIRGQSAYIKNILEVLKND